MFMDRSFGAPTANCSSNCNKQLAKQQTAARCLQSLIPVHLTNALTTLNFWNTYPPPPTEREKKRGQFRVCEYTVWDKRIKWTGITVWINENCGHLCFYFLIYILIDQNSQKKHLTTMKGSLIGKKGQPKHSSSLTFDTNEGWFIKMREKKNPSIQIPKISKQTRAEK